MVHVLATAHSSLFPRVAAVRPLVAEPDADGACTVSVWGYNLGQEEDTLLARSNGEGPLPPAWGLLGLWFRAPMGDGWAGRRTRCRPAPAAMGVQQAPRVAWPALAGRGARFARRGPHSSRPPVRAAPAPACRRRVRGG